MFSITSVTSYLQAPENKRKFMNSQIMDKNIANWRYLLIRNIIMVINCREESVGTYVEVHVARRR